MSKPPDQVAAPSRPGPSKGAVPPEEPVSPKDDLGRRACDVLAERGVGDLSLRQLAALLGTSHRMLLYHFGSKEGLLTEVVRETERRQQQALAELTASPASSDPEVARRLWRRLCSPELAPLERLFFEVYGRALAGDRWARPLLDGVVDDWVALAVPRLRAGGLSEADARAEARLGLAVVRGLLLDLLATGETAAVEDAFERFLGRSPAPGTPPDPTG